MRARRLNVRCKNTGKENAMPYGLYVHIPFCRSRCRYCDFYSQPASGAVPEEYIDALVRDFLRYAPKDADGQPEHPASVYFGGGTPGLLNAAQVEKLLAVFAPAAGAEVTMEVNPESATPEKLAGFWAAGVRRLSVGVQSARDGSLKTLGRLHTAADARRALAAAGAAGFQNISGDIMLGLPGYSRAEFDETLALLAEGGATHISAYLLKIEPETAFGKKTPTGLPDADETADFYLYAADRLQARGYRQYEISNFAKSGNEGRHNLLYWRGEEYLGVGPAAASCLAGQRFCFAPDVAAFLGDELSPTAEGAYTKEDYLMLRLRLCDGVDEEELARRFGSGLSAQQRQVVEELVAHGLANSTEKGFALTVQGFLVQNAVLARLL